MEICPKISMKYHMDCEDDMKKDQPVAHQRIPCPREVICPEPRRIIRFPHTVDSLERLCTLKSDYTTREDPSVDILRMFLSMDGAQDDLDVNNNHMGLLCGSPPVRTGNPLVHDVQFTRQASTLAPTLGNSHGDIGTSARVERVPNCGNSNFGGKPLVRVEGFSCDNSKSRRVVAAFA